MKSRLFGLLTACVLVLSACTSVEEINIVTRTPSYQGLIAIGGGVNNPGLYPFSAEDRLADLISAAGGLKEGADVSKVELSLGVRDTSQKVDINRAEAWLLEALPGIGETTAKNIIAYRETNGAFHCADDLLKVTGIGPALLTAITPYITVSGE